MKDWKKTIYKPRPALIDIKRKSIHLYKGQKFDSSKFKLDKEGWTHEHCDECFMKIEVDDIFFELEGEVLCEKCYPLIP